MHVSKSLSNWHWIICIGYREYSDGKLYMQIVDGWNNRIDRYYRPGYGSAWIASTQYYIKSKLY